MIRSGASGRHVLRRMPASMWSLFTFQAPLQTSVVLAAGSGSASFTRASVATVRDFEGNLKNVLSGEVRFEGQRRVFNGIVVSSENWSGYFTGGANPPTITANTSDVTDPNGGNTANKIVWAVAGTGNYLRNVNSLITSVTGSMPIINSVWLRGAVGGEQIIMDNGWSDNPTTLTLTTGWRRYSAVHTSVVAGRTMFLKLQAVPAITPTIYAAFGMIESGLGAANLNPSEYVSVGVLSSPYQGAMVDGVQYFSTQNGNTVSSNVVTAGTGAPCYGYTSGAFTNTNYGYLTEGSRTNLCQQSSTFASWTAISTPSITDNSVMLGDIGLSLLNDTSGAALQGASMAVTYTGNAQKSVSFIVKQGSSTSSVVRVRDTTASADRLLVAVTWSGGAPVLTYTTGSSERASDALGNGAFRCYALSTSVTAANANQIEVYPATDAALSVGATGTCYLGAMQTEDAAFASSHIPTTTATVTRNADAETYPTAGNFSDTAGTMYFEAFVPNWSAATGVFVGSATNGAKASSANSGVQAFDGTNTANGPAGSPSGWIKAAVAWSGSTMKVCVNGVLGANQSYDGSWNLSSIGIGVGTFALLRNVRIAQVALSDGQLQSITT